MSGTLILRGEPGVGKTALLDDAVASAAAAGMQTTRVTAVESETQLGYAALHRLLLPYPGYVERLPDPQSRALQSTFGLVAGPPADRFLVALGVLTLLAEVASEAPLLCVVDDAQWLDHETIRVLGFVARRLHAEGVALLVATRQPNAPDWAMSPVPDLTIGGLEDADAIELLAAVTTGRLSPAVGARLVAGIGGNPLALVELARELPPAQLAGSEALPEPIGASLQHVFSRRVDSLPLDARLLLAVAAAEPAGTADVLFRAARDLGVDAEAALSAGLEDLVEFTPQVVFRHPLVRSAAYHDIPPSRQRLVHRALATAADAQHDPDRAAWHLGMAAAGPDDTVAARLEEAAEHQRERGGYAATATFLSRSAQLSAQEGSRARRLLAASQAALVAGQHHQARELLDQARTGTTELQAGTALRMSGQLSLAAGQLAEATSQLLAAARLLTPVDASLARQTLLGALEAANQAGRAAIEEMRTVAAEILPAMPTSITGLTLADRLLFGFLHRFEGNYRQAAVLLRSVVAELLDQAVPEDLRLPWMRLASQAAYDLLDEDAMVALAIEHVRLARRLGALTALPLALNAMADVYVRRGRFALADQAYDEARQIAAATGNSGLRGLKNLQDIVLLCWRGHEEKARITAAEATADVLHRGLGWTVGLVHARVAVLELGLGNYADALDRAMYYYGEDPISWGTWLLPELVEAAVRCGERGIAQQALSRLAARAEAGGAPWGLGLLARSRALIADDADAEPL